MMAPLDSLPTLHIVIVFGIIIVVFWSFVREKLPSDIVALLAMSALILTGILSVPEVLTVFSNPAPITVAAMFVLSAALERTGAITAAGRTISSIATKGGPLLAVTLLIGGVMILSAFINNTPVIVIMIPITIQLARTIGISPSRLLIPLSFAAIFGGTSTLIGTSTNILVDGVAQKAGLDAFGMFEITGAGLCLALVGTVYMAFAGRFILPDRETVIGILPDPVNRRFLANVVIPIDSVLIGKTISESRLMPRRGFSVIDLIRNDVSMREQLHTLHIEAGDWLVLRSPISEMLALREAGDLAIGVTKNDHAFEPITADLSVVMEGVVGPQSILIGRAISETGIRRHYGVYILAIHRRGESVTHQKQQLIFEVGDTVLLEGPAKRMRQLFDSGALTNLSQASEKAVRRDKAKIAILAIFLVMVLASFEVLPIAGLALVAAISVVAFGCLDHQEAYRAIRWDIMMLIFGMLALGAAMESTGAAELIVHHLVTLIGSFGPLAVLAVLYLLTSLLTEIMSNNATAILLTPIAIGLGVQLGVDPRPFVVAVMFAASASFATPIGYQTNTLVYGAGGYKFTDFLKVGVPLNIIFFATSMVVIPMFWPLVEIS